MVTCLGLLGTFDASRYALNGNKSLVQTKVFFQELISIDLTDKKPIESASP
jgi:hypothetical protein